MTQNLWVRIDWISAENLPCGRAQTNFGIFPGAREPRPKFTLTPASPNPTAHPHLPTASTGSGGEIPPSKKETEVTGSRSMRIHWPTPPRRAGQTEASATHKGVDSLENTRLFRVSTFASPPREGAPAAERMKKRLFSSAVAFGAHLREKEAGIHPIKARAPAIRVDCTRLFRGDFCIGILRGVAKS